MRNLFSCLTCFPLVYTDKRDGSLSILKIAAEEIPFVNEVSLPNNWRGPSLDRIFLLYPGLLCLKKRKRRNMQTTICVGFPEQQKLKGNRVLNWAQEHNLPALWSLPRLKICSFPRHWACSLIIFYLPIFPISACWSAFQGCLQDWQVTSASSEKCGWSASLKFGPFYPDFIAWSQRAGAKHFAHSLTQSSFCFEKWWQEAETHKCTLCFTTPAEKLHQFICDLKRKTPEQWMYKQADL